MTTQYDGGHTYDSHLKAGTVFVKYFVGGSLNFIGETGGMVYK
jgi:hypothetical protein